MELSERAQRWSCLARRHIEELGPIAPRWASSVAASESLQAIPDVKTAYLEAQILLFGQSRRDFIPLQQPHRNPV